MFSFPDSNYRVAGGSENLEFVSATRLVWLRLRRVMLKHNLRTWPSSPTRTGAVGNLGISSDSPHLAGGHFERAVGHLRQLDRARLAILGAGGLARARLGDGRPGAVGHLGRSRLPRARLGRRPAGRGWPAWPNRAGELGNLGLTFVLTVHALSPTRLPSATAADGAQTSGPRIPEDWLGQGDEKARRRL